MKETDQDFYPPYHYFVCDCDKDKEFHEMEGLKAHVKENHGIDLNGLKGTRNLMLHINKKPRHASSYRWTFDGGLTLYEYYG